MLHLGEGLPSDVMGIIAVAAEEARKWRRRHRAAGDVRARASVPLCSVRMVFVVSQTLRYDHSCDAALRVERKRNVAEVRALWTWQALLSGSDRSGAAFLSCSASRSATRSQAVTSTMCRTRMVVMWRAVARSCAVSAVCGSRLEAWFPD
jgi:hypothetical protein